MQNTPDEQFNQLLEEEKLKYQQTLQKKLKIHLHELKNLVASIVTSSQLITRDSLSPERKDRMKENILKTANRFGDLVKELLAMDFNEELVIEEVSLHDILTQAIDTLTVAFESKNIQFHTDYDDSAPSIHANREELYQVFHNIILNACEAISELNRSIWVTCKTTDHQILIKLKDNGPGIPEDVLPKIFDVFTYGKENGNGYGLKITLDIIHKYDGNVDVSSKVGEGTTFTVTFPAKN